MKIEIKKTFWKSLSVQTKTLIGSALGFVAALAWNDAIQTLIIKILPLNSASSIVLKFVYAIAVTLIAVTLVFYISQIGNWKKKKHKK